MKNGNKFNFLYNLANPVIFDSSGEFAYIPINKAGQRSITRELLKDRVVIKKDDKEAWKLYADKFLNESSWAKLTTFGICRHPLDKFISAYFYLYKLKYYTYMYKRKFGVYFFLSILLHHFQVLCIIEFWIEKIKMVKLL